MKPTSLQRRLGKYWLQRLGNYPEDLCSLFPGVIVLLGGALLEKMPRDIDVRCIVRNGWWVRRFGRTVEEWLKTRGDSYQRTIVKENAHLDCYIPAGVGSDLKVWPRKVFQPAVPHIVLYRPAWMPLYWYDDPDNSSFVSDWAHRTSESVKQKNGSWIVPLPKRRTA